MATKQDAIEVARTVKALESRKADGRDSIMDALALHRISGSIHRYDERVCSVEMSEREAERIEKRVASLERKAREIAEAYGYRVYFQGDCRGCPVYLIDKSFPPDEDDSHYSSRGLAVVWLG